MDVPVELDDLPAPVIDGPITLGAGRAVMGAGGLDLGPLGYVEEEFFVTGGARSFASADELATDGRWQVNPQGSAPFRTRVLVRRPVAATGPVAVLVEWLNVSGGLDADPDWTFLHNEFIRSGHVWVGVSAQRDGIFPGGNPIGEMLSLVKADPDRYGSLEHPGDDHSYDIYGQVGALVRNGSARLLGGLEPDVVVAIGESQSAERLTTYVNSFAHDGVFDGYLLHSRHAVGAPLHSELATVPDPTLLRDDLAAPVMVLSAENDVVGQRIGYSRARQPDHPKLVAWEIAGTAHVDAYGLGIGDHDDGSGAADDDLFDAMAAPPSSVYFGVIECESPINTGPHTYVARAAISHLVRWVRGGTPPPAMPRLVLGADGDLERDEAGNAVGGVRTPHVDVPLATLSGAGQVAGGFCELFGTTTPLDAAELARRYPDRSTFESAWDAALDAAVTAGAVLVADAEQLRVTSRRARLG